MSLLDLALPLFRCVDAERAHLGAIRALRLAAPFLRSAADDPILAQTLWGRAFPNPLGIAAGFDKHAEVPDALLALGFGFAEIGSVTPRPQPGNSRPRVFRLDADRAVINRYGFNSEGIPAVAARLARRQRRGVLGVNLGKNKETADAADDYVAGVKALAGFADYVVVNVSSPNTPGLRALQDRAALDGLVARVQAAMPAGAPPPLLVKIAPDLTAEDLADVADVALARGLAGVIVSNTTLARPESLQSAARSETGGLSGAPLMGPSTEMLRRMRRLTAGKLVLIGVGGVSSGTDAYAKIRAGASLVQLYTALAFEGPGLIGRIKRDLVAALRRDGFKSVTDAVGVEA
ncbi:MAG: quinone-dependent dihydroorotate dehydrogenase [Alphaproteobacteria bacterium]|nr:quinone-dependent dihydroorotate dehydrogenase [Alphaproteobacteria bacterium]